MNNEWLKEAILDYVGNSTDRLNLAEIVSYFRLRGDITFAAIAALQDEGKIIRVDNIAGGIDKAYYKVIKEQKDEQRL